MDTFTGQDTCLHLREWFATKLSSTSSRPTPAQRRVGPLVLSSQQPRSTVSNSGTPCVWNLPYGTLWNLMYECLQYFPYGTSSTSYLPWVIPPGCHVLSASSVEEGGTDYSDDGVRGLSGTLNQEPETQAYQTLTKRELTL